MANRLSDLLTNMLAVPSVKNAVNLGLFTPKFMIATTSILAADADATIYPVFRVPGDWKLMELWVHNDAITGGTDYDFGLYDSGDWNSADQTVRDKDIYCDGISMATARNTFVHNDTAGAVEASLGSAGACLGAVVGGGAITGILRTRNIHLDAGISAANFVPGRQFDCCWTANTVGTGAGTIITIGLFATNM